MRSRPQIAPWIAIPSSLDCYLLLLGLLSTSLELLSTPPWIAIHFPLDCYPLSLDYYPINLGLISTPSWIAIHSSLNWYPLLLKLLSTSPWIAVESSSDTSWMLSTSPWIAIDSYSDNSWIAIHSPWITIQSTLDWYPPLLGLLSNQLWIDILSSSIHSYHFLVFFFFFLIKWLYFKIFFILCGIIIWTDIVWMVYARCGSVLKSFWIVGLVV